MTLFITRVAYGKESTPIKDREYKITGLKDSPVGSEKEWEEFIKDKNFTKVEII